MLCSKRRQVDIVSPCAMVGLGTGTVFGCGMNGMPYAKGATELPTIPLEVVWLPALLPPLLFTLLFMYFVRSAAKCKMLPQEYPGNT